VQGLLEAADSGVGLGPEDPVDLQAFARVAGQVAELELLLDPADGVALAALPDRDDQRRPGGGADDAVDGQALLLLEGADGGVGGGPKMPSTVRVWPRARSRYCRVLTGCSWSPLRTSGHGLIVAVVIGSSSLDVDSGPRQGVPHFHGTTP
jgi:hypothetical protein